MSGDSDRLNALRLAAHRAALAKRGVKPCRLCGGDTRGELFVYCARHYAMLPPRHGLSEQIKNGDYKTSDAIIKLKERIPLRYVTENIVEIGNPSWRRAGMQLRRDGKGVWVLYLRRKTEATETVLSRFARLHEALAYVLERQHDFSAHNKWAVKSIVR